MFCYKCGTQAMADAEWCGHCGANVRAPVTPTPPVYAPQPHVLVVKSGKSAGLAAILSFLWCGLGQIYNGEIAKGVIFVVLHIVSVLAMAILIGWLTTPVLWIWGMVDAYRTSERLNREAGLA
jgi:TM2 domain-containing membrane protein YozV